MVTRGWVFLDVIEVQNVVGPWDGACTPAPVKARAIKDVW